MEKKDLGAGEQQQPASVEQGYFPEKRVPQTITMPSVICDATEEKAEGRQDTLGSVDSRVTTQCRCGEIVG